MTQDFTCDLVIALSSELVSSCNLATHLSSKDDQNICRRQTTEYPFQGLMKYYFIVLYLCGSLGIKHYRSIRQNNFLWQIQRSMCAWLQLNIDVINMYTRPVYTKIQIRLKLLFFSFPNSLILAADQGQCLLSMSFLSPWATEESEQ